MSAIESLIRIHRWQVDERRRHVAELEGLADKLRQEIVRLGEEHHQEQEAAAKTPEASQAYPGYVGQMLDRQRTLERSLAEAEGQLMQARDAFTAAFQELKRYEIAGANRERHRLQQLARRERMELDAVAIENFRRRTGSTGNES